MTTSPASSRHGRRSRAVLRCEASPSETNPALRPAEHSPADLAKAISRESARIHRESYALVPTTVLTRLDDDAVVSVLAFDLLAGEEAMIAAGCADTVLTLRHRSELELEPALTAAVERTTGRKVRRFLTQTDLEEGIAFEVYLLAPAQRAAA